MLAALIALLALLALAAVAWATTRQEAYASAADVGPYVHSKPELDMPIVANAHLHAGTANAYSFADKVRAHQSVVADTLALTPATGDLVVASAPAGSLNSVPQMFAEIDRAKHTTDVVQGDAERKVAEITRRVRAFPRRRYAAPETTRYRVRRWKAKKVCPAMERFPDRTPTPSIQACAAKCLRTPECKYFAYNNTANKKVYVGCGNTHPSEEQCQAECPDGEDEEGGGGLCAEKDTCYWARTRSCRDGWKDSAYYDQYEITTTHARG